MWGGEARKDTGTPAAQARGAGPRPYLPLAAARFSGSNPASPPPSPGLPAGEKQPSAWTAPRAAGLSRRLLRPPDTRTDGQDCPTRRDGGQRPSRAPASPVMLGAGSQQGRRHGQGPQRRALRFTDDGPAKHFPRPAAYGTGTETDEDKPARPGPASARRACGRGAAEALDLACDERAGLGRHSGGHRAATEGPRRCEGRHAPRPHGSYGRAPQNCPWNAPSRRRGTLGTLPLSRNSPLTSLAVHVAPRSSGGNAPGPPTPPRTPGLLPRLRPCPGPHPCPPPRRSTQSSGRCAKAGKGPGTL